MHHPAQRNHLVSERSISASSPLFDLNGETKMARTNSSAIIVR